MDVLRLVLVDDYRMVTEALASRLSSAPDLWVAGCCQTDDPRLPEVVRWLRPDIVLIDVEPLGIAIGEVLGRIREAWPDARMIVVSADGDVTHAVEAARAGADAWVSKSQGADQLETVLRGVARGHSWFPPDMLGEVIRALRDDVRTARESSNLLDTLSPRELDVLASMAKGKRARQIAAELMISADTVRTHTRSIFGKLEVHSRIEAVSVAWAAGLRPEEGQQGGEDRPERIAPPPSAPSGPSVEGGRRPPVRRREPGGEDKPAGRAGRGPRPARDDGPGRGDRPRHGARPPRGGQPGQPGPGRGGQLAIGTEWPAGGGQLAVGEIRRGGQVSAGPDGSCGASGAREPGPASPVEVRPQPRLRGNPATGGPPALGSNSRLGGPGTAGQPAGPAAVRGTGSAPAGP